MWGKGGRQANCWTRGGTEKEIRGGERKRRGASSRVGLWSDDHIKRKRPKGGKVNSIRAPRKYFVESAGGNWGEKTIEGRVGKEGKSLGNDKLLSNPGGQSVITSESTDDLVQRQPPTREAKGGPERGGRGKCGITSLGRGGRAGGKNYSERGKANANLQREGC